MKHFKLLGIVAVVLLSMFFSCSNEALVKQCELTDFVLYNLEEELII